MRAGKAKRRWLKRGRYVAATQTRANPRRKWGTDLHDGHTGAYYGAMFAKRWAPIGAREVWFPRWMAAERRR